jgi:hypothetical protein
VRLSDDIGPTLSGPGSPAPRRRRGRKKTLAAALAVTAAAGVVGLTQATTASAATVSAVLVDVSLADANNWGAGWGKAWDQCRSRWPTTKSVEFVSSSPYSTGNPTEPVRADQIWECRDTP